MLYFHHDNREFKIGDIIQGNHYDIHQDILKEYADVMNSHSIHIKQSLEDILYITPVVHENWEYDNVYLIHPLSRVFEVNTNYSIVLCNEEVDRRFPSSSDVLDRDECIRVQRHDFIKNMAGAYVGEACSMESLDTFYGYSYDKNSYDKEYITDSGIVSKAILNYHEDYVSAVYEMMYHGLADALHAFALGFAPTSLGERR